MSLVSLQLSVGSSQPLSPFLPVLQDIDMSGFIKNPKWYIGYSDNTAIQSLLLKNGFASIHGQTLKTASFGVEEKAYTSIFKILEGKKTIYTLPKNPPQ